METPTAGIKLDKEMQRALDKEVGLLKVRVLPLNRSSHAPPGFCEHVQMPVGGHVRFHGAVQLT